MKIELSRLLIAGSLIIAGLSGCGGGGSSELPAGNTKINGTAAKGIIYPGLVNVYEVNANGQKGRLLAGSVATDINGKYSAALRSYSGAIVVEASGTYTDEATGRSMTIDPARPLHAMVESVNETTDNNKVVAVTPLTEIAWRKASGNGRSTTVPSNMTSANKLVSNLFKVNDVVATEPVRPDNASMAGASADAQTYTLALATISEMAKSASGSTDTEKLESVISRFETEVEGAETSDSMSSSAISEFTNAMGNVSMSTDFPSAKEKLSGMGRKSQSLTLATSGTLPTGTTIYAIQGSLAVPAKVTFRTDGNGMALKDILSLTGIATGLGIMDPIANYQGPQQQLDFLIQFDPSKTGIGIGDFATLTYEVAAGNTITAADFSIITGSLFVKDANGNDINGITVILR